MSGISIIRLGCVGCGASLQIGADMKQLACGHCGTSQLVERYGSSIHLKEFAHTLSRVQVGTDKTAAELAIARLTKEQNDLIAQRRDYENRTFAHRHSRNQFWATQIQNTSSSLMVLSLIGVGAGGFLGLIVSIVIGNILSAMFGAGAVQVAFFLGFLLVFGLAGGGGYVIYRLLANSKGHNIPKLKSKRDSELAAIDAQVKATRLSFDAQMKTKNEQINRNRQIANS